MQESEYHAMAALEERHWWYRSLRSRVMARLEKEARRLGRPLEVFDAGCGTGGLLVALKGQRWISAASGCDRHPVALAYARSRGLHVSEASVNDLEIGAGCFDVVLSMDVIYHREVKPAAAMAAMASRLRPGGLLLLNTAAMPCLWRQHDRKVMGGRRLLPGPLRRLTADAGLEVEHLQYWNSWLTPLLWLQCRLEALGPSGAVSEAKAQAPAATTPAGQPAQVSDVQLPPLGLNQALVLLLRLEASCSGVLPLPWGSSLMLSARRPETGARLSVAA
jgi:2-polyprenyl-3-methyl-5-hydroxy-6-metoxy-1,4-benzoquinol methylase